MSLSVSARSLLLAAAMTTAQITTADENDPVGWQDSPPRRGTIDILKSCVITIVACTWSIQHLNVPSKKDHDSIFRSLARRASWMLITILLPEFIMTHAVFEFMMAWQTFRSMEEKIDAIIDPPWWFKFFFRRPSAPAAGPGRDEEEEEAVDKAPAGEGPRVRWTLAHSYFANMGGFYYKGDESSFPLTGVQLAKEWDGLGPLKPTITEDEILDKAKTDIFAKTIAVLQILQLILSLIVRKARHLPFSQLETLTLSFAVCGFGTYLVYWYKPQNVGVPVTITSSSRPSGRSESDSRKVSHDKTYDRLWSVLTNAEFDSDRSRVKNDNIPIMASQTGHLALPVLAFMAAGFGSLHCIAWNFEFPTTVEKDLWRVASILSLAVPALGLLSIPLAQVSKGWGSPREFTRQLLSLLRELSWNSDPSVQAKAIEVRLKLENVYNNPDSTTRYEEILGREVPTASGQPKAFRHELLALAERMVVASEVPSAGQKDFVEQLNLLVALIDGKGSKKLALYANVKSFPRRSALLKEVNLFILYSTGLIYCLSRLTIVGLAISSLRSMPAEVYITTWTRYIPAV